MNVGDRVAVTICGNHAYNGTVHELDGGYASIIPDGKGRDVQRAHVSTLRLLEAHDA